MGKGQSRVSVLVVEEAFASGDSRFLEYFDQIDGQAAARIVEKWKRDHRPWAREQLLKELERARGYGGHSRLVIKRFFKHADATGDDGLMAVFLRFFDRQVRRVRRSRWSWDSVSRSMIQRPPVLRAVGGGVFDARTSYYCRRRAWRYFRRMGFKRFADYPAAVAKALALYRDEDLADGDAILDSWSLMHACFGESDAVAFNSTHARLMRPANLDGMVAPYFPDLWRKPESARVLLDLLLSSQARVVRGWAMQLVRREHADRLREVSAEDLLRLLDHDDENVQRFGAELLDGASAAGRFDVPTWLRLLNTRSLTALGVIVEAMSKHVRAADLTIARRVDLARAKPVPVARLGLEFLREASFQSETDRRELARLATAQAEGVGREIASFALSVLGSPGDYDPDTVVRFFDSLNPAIRQGAWDWLVEGCAGWADPALWSRLVETPYDDVRQRFIAALESRQRAAAPLPAWKIGPAALAGLWSSVLLAIHRGGRAKLAALRQITQALAAQSDQAETLLPVVAVAIRSVRFPESRAGLAAVVRAIAMRPDIEPLVRRHLPELTVEQLPAGREVAP